MSIDPVQLMPIVSAIVVGLILVWSGSLSLPRVFFMIHNFFNFRSIGMIPLITSTASSDTVLYADDMRSAAVSYIFSRVLYLYSLSSESDQISAPYRRTACVVGIKSLLLLCVGPPMLGINLRCRGLRCFLC